MKNPFIIGKPVVGVDFINRQQELARLVYECKNSSRVFLISPRQYGKTSLLLNLINKLKGEKYPAAHVDLFGISSIKDFYEKYSTAVFKNISTRLDEMADNIKQFIRQLKPSISINPENGTPKLSLDTFEKLDISHSSIEELLNLPQIIAEKRGKTVTIAFDEFQEINKLGGIAFEKQIRSILQYHHNVGYIFCGSQQDIMMDMINNQNRPFYEMGYFMTLKKLPKNEFKQAIGERFIANNYHADNSSLDLVFDVTHNIPNAVQKLCWYLFMLNSDSKHITNEQVNEGVLTILDEEHPRFSTLFEMLTLNQRKVIKALAHQGKKQLLSSESLSQFQLKSPTSAHSAINSLLKKRLLEKVDNELTIADVFFEIWIREMIS